MRRKGNDLDDHTIREELEGNICRCTGYHNIVSAIAAGAPPQGHAGGGSACGKAAQEYGRHFVGRGIAGGAIS